jgi:hypothetical protein
MILYHYTAVERLDSIRKHGLTRGEVPLTPQDCLNAVWLTTDRNPSGHGLCHARELTREEKLFFGRDPNKSVWFPNKRAVRITVRLDSSDRKLKHWPRWAKQRLSPQWYQALDRAGGGKSKTWWLYFGVIPPEWFSSVDILSSPPPVRDPLFEGSVAGECVWNGSVVSFFSTNRRRPVVDHRAGIDVRGYLSV